MCKDYTQIKYEDDKRDFINYEDIEKARLKFQRKSPVVIYNHLTKDTRYFETLTDAAEFLNVTPGTLSEKMKKEIKIFPSGWEAKYVYDDRMWSNPTEQMLRRIISGGVDTRPIKIINFTTGESKEFSKLKDAAEYFNGTSTKILHRLKVNQTRPCRDGYLYRYL